MTQHNSDMDTHHGNIPYITMNLCKYIGDDYVTLEQGIVAYFDAACPSGRAHRLDAGEGRAMMFARPGVPANAHGTKTESGGQLGRHGHALQNCHFRPRQQGSGNWGLYGRAYAHWNGDGFTFLQRHPTSIDSLNIGYHQCNICEVSNSATAYRKLPPSSLIFFRYGSACPAYYHEISSNAAFIGRVPKVRGNNLPASPVGQTYGGTPSTLASGTYTPYGFSQHTHRIVSKTSFTFAGRGTHGAWDCCNWWFIHWNNYQNHRFTCHTHGVSQGELLPLFWGRGCRAQQPTSSPTRSPSRRPTTSSPTKSPSRYPTLQPSSAPTKSPTAFPSREPTTSRPSRAPVTGSPTSSPETSSPTLSPTDHPTTSPTPAPVWVNVCHESDQDLFQNYDNFVIQAGSCSDECAIDILTSPLLGRKCVDLCVSIELYTPVCRYCIADFALCQESKCRTRCVSNRFSASCAECTNTNCREAFNLCTGLSGSQLEAGGGDGGENAPPPKQGQRVNYALIAGSTLGALIGLSAALFVSRKYQVKRKLTKDVQDDMENKLFRGGKDFEGGTLVYAGDLEADNPRLNPVQFGAAPLAAAGVVLSSSRPDVTDTSVAGKLLRSRYSFQGTEHDEINVDAGISLTAIERNADWYLVRDENTKRIGLIPASYVIDT